MPDQRASLGLQAEDGASAAKMKISGPAGGGTAASYEMTGRPSDLNITVKNTESLLTSQTSAVQLQSEIRYEADSVKLNANPRHLVSENIQIPKVTNAMQSPDVEDSKTRESVSVLRDGQNVMRIENPRQGSAPASGQEPLNEIQTARDIRHAQSETGPNLISSQEKGSESRLQGPYAEEPFTRVFQGAHQPKDGAVRVESGPAEETIAKVIKTESGNNDNGLLNSAGHQADKTAETSPSSKETESGRRSLQHQTLDQIVQKAAIHLRNGQHEARIDLKPDFLGQIRMQVISENQQVTVRILAEHGFVKEMIEGNVHQLKTDLLQQGLEMDKLEISVSRDPEDAGNNKDKFAQLRARQGSADNNKKDHPSKDQPEKSRRTVLVENGGSTVDFFA